MVLVLRNSAYDAHAKSSFWAVDKLSDNINICLLPSGSGRRLTELTP
jgi:hypothetical protein